MTAFRDPLYALEDTLIDLNALVKLVLHMSETCEKSEFGEKRDVVNTALYLMLDKLAKIDGQHTAMWTTENQLGRDMETLQ